jgi:hypothetical protein
MKWDKSVLEKKYVLTEDEAAQTIMEHFAHDIARDFGSEGKVRGNVVWTGHEFILTVRKLK